MTDNSQMTEQIFTNIDALGATMESTIDLSSDVAPFMSSTLAKIKQLAMAKQGDYEAQYELFQIATNYLPRTINSYCALPIEYRNTRIVKSDKTARQLLIDNLKLFKQQVLELEKQFYAAIETQIKVDSSFVREKYAGQLELATELDKVGEEGFINQFDYSQYKESPHYKDITFKRELSEKEIQAKERSIEISKKISNIGNKAQSFGNFLLNSTFTVLKFMGRATALFLEGLFGVIAALAFPICLIGAIGGIFTVAILTNRDSSMLDAVEKTSSDIHKIMENSIIPSGEFASFINAKTTELLDDSDFRKERLKVTYNINKHYVSMQITDVERNLCRDLIDRKEDDFDFALVRINGIPLPQDNTVSDRNSWTNENHTLCHLDEGNKITLDLNNQKIYDFAKGVALTEAGKASKIALLEKEFTIIDTASKQYANSKYESHFDGMKNKVKKALEQVKATKPVNYVK